MTKKYEVGDHVARNSEAGHVSGTIVTAHIRDLDYNGYIHHASEDDPQYETKMSKTAVIVALNAQLLRRTEP